MTHFYFHIFDGHSPADDVGVDLANIEAAKQEALRFAGEVLSEDKPRDIWQGKVWEMRVTDDPSPENGQVLLTLTLSGDCSDRNR